MNKNSRFFSSPLDEFPFFCAQSAIFFHSIDRQSMRLFRRRWKQFAIFLCIIKKLLIFSSPINVIWDFFSPIQKMCFFFCLNGKTRNISWSIGEIFYFFLCLTEKCLILTMPYQRNVQFFCASSTQFVIFLHLFNEIRNFLCSIDEICISYD